MSNADLPILDLSALVERSDGHSVGCRRVGAELARAAREAGFFYVRGHGVEPELLRELERCAREFFSLDVDVKLESRMELGGSAWRGYFPVGAEQTSGRADLKEGLYFGAELARDDPRVRARTPLFGPNLFPRVEGLRESVLAYMGAMTGLGHRLMTGLAIGLGLEPTYFEDHGTRDPLTLFRIFHYPPPAPGAEDDCGVGEHTDYGLLTILHQDANGGLQVRSRERWIDAPPRAGALLCNIGDMLERISAGRLRSTLHRVRNTSGHGRLSFPFFFDPNFDARLQPIADVVDADYERWDGGSVHAFAGTYGEYVTAKVTRVFPDLARAVLARPG